MMKAPSILTAAVMLAVFLCYGNSYACADCVCARDNTCSNVACGTNPTANCTRVEFEPVCNGTYTFYVETNCSGENCGGCQACASVWKIVSGVETLAATCETNGCNVNVCTQSCSVSLSPGSTYVLYVCKVPCAGPAEDCEDCKVNCEAVGCVSYGVTSQPCE